MFHTKLNKSINSMHFCLFVLCISVQLFTLTTAATLTYSPGSCERGLQKVLEKTSPNKDDDCYELEQGLVELVENCRVDDAVRFVALLRTAVNELDYTGCLGNTPLKETDCDEMLACFRPVFTTAPSSFFCGPNKRNLYTSRDCLANKRCHAAERLGTSLATAAEELCNGGACISDAGVFRSVPNTSCLQYEWLIPTTGEIYKYNTSPGTQFGVDICHHRFDGYTPCWN